MQFRLEEPAIVAFAQAKRLNLPLVFTLRDLSLTSYGRACSMKLSQHNKSTLVIGEHLVLEPPVCSRGDIINSKKIFWINICMSLSKQNIPRANRIRGFTHPVQLHARR